MAGMEDMKRSGGGGGGGGGDSHRASASHTPRDEADGDEDGDREDDDKSTVADDDQDEQAMAEGLGGEVETALEGDEGEEELDENGERRIKMGNQFKKSHSQVQKKAVLEVSQSIDKYTTKTPQHITQ